MDDSMLLLLKKGGEDDIIRILSSFNGKNSQVFRFPEISKEIKSKFADILVTILKKSSSASCWTVCLTAVRILSRDKQDVNELAKSELILCVLRVAGLNSSTNSLSCDDRSKMDQNYAVIVEAQKSLSNLIYNSPLALRLCCSNGCIEGIFSRLCTYKDSQIPQQVRYFDMKILFLLTALCPDTRTKLKNELHGLMYLIEVLDLTVKENDLTVKLDDERVNLTCEILKVLYNLTVNCNDTDLDEDEEAHYLRLVSILHDIILTETVSESKKDELLGNAVNLLTTMPASSYEELLTRNNNDSVSRLSSDASDYNKDIEYDGMNVECLHELLKFLEHRLEKSSAGNRKEMCSAILTCLCLCTKANRVIRKYLKSKILPPIHDVHIRPEEGSTIKSKLCQLMTLPVNELNHLSAELLFVLCKESVPRFVKYTGYGNAAGLLASRGLMMGNKSKPDLYSSESEDSDTEEYKNHKDRINPILGCYEPPRPDPLSGMSEDQKEYEAVQLANLMDKLSRDKVIQPMKVGEDGRPHPIEHILELTDGDPNVRQSNHHSDDDD